MILLHFDNLPKTNMFDLLQLFNYISLRKGIHYQQILKLSENGNNQSI